MSKKKSDYLEELKSNNHLKYFISRLIEIRKSKSLSQIELSNISGLNLRMVNEIENFKIMPSLDTICKLADAMSISPALFFIEQTDEDLIDLVNIRDKNRIKKLMK